MDLPLISVLLPVYNSEKYVKSSIESILNQTYTNFEIIVVDDGSSDNTEAIIKKIQDKRVNYYKNEKNLTLAPTLNKGLLLCRGKYIARMDADDVSLPERFQKQVDFLEKNPDYLLVGSAYYVERDGVLKGVRRHVLSYKKLKSKLLFGNNISHPSVMINRQLLLDSGELYNEAFRYAQDYDLWTRLIINYKMGNLFDPLIIYRRYEGVSSMEKSSITNENFMKSQINYILNLFDSIDEKQAKDLYLFFRRPQYLKKRKACLLFFRSITLLFTMKEVDRLDFFLRIANQFKKTIYK